MCSCFSSSQVDEQNLIINNADEDIKIRPNRPEESIRAQKNWGILRTHIREMKFTANHLVIYLAEANEAKLETKYGQES